MTDNQSPGDSDHQLSEYLQSNDDRERERFWKGVHEDYERLRADPADWKDYQDEVTMFEGGSMDGLDEEEPYYSQSDEEAIRGSARSHG